MNVDSQGSPGKRHPLVGTVVEPYAILDVIAAGGMGVVFKAKHKLTDRIVAMKLLPAELARDDSNVQRVKLEAKALAQLKHPNIVTTFDFGSTYMQEPFIVMEYVPGESLKEVLDREVLLPINRAVRIFLQVVDAMRYAHAAGILHRDLKPHNVMVSNEPDQDHVKVLDFGVAKLAEYTQRITRTGEVVGSPLYMSPEQCTGRPTDQRCDIYSIGVMMFETLTGSPPFRGENYISTVHLKCTKLAPSFRDVVPGKVFPEKLEMIVLKCLEIEPENRYTSMAELKSELELVAGTMPKGERSKTGIHNPPLSTTGSTTSGFKSNNEPISPIISSSPGTGEVGWKPSWSGETTPTPKAVPSPSSYDKWSDSIASIETSDKELFKGPQQSADTGGLSRGAWSGPGTEVTDEDSRRPSKPNSVASDRTDGKPQIGKLLTQDLASLSAALEASTVERTKTGDRLPAQNPTTFPGDITGDKPVVTDESSQPPPRPTPVPVPDAKNKQGDSHFVLTWDSKSGPSWSATSAAPQKLRPPAPAPAPLSPPRANPTGSNPVLSGLVQKEPGPSASRSGVPALNDPAQAVQPFGPGPTASHSSMPAAPSGSTAPQQFTPPSQPGPTASQNSIPTFQSAPRQFNPMASHSSMPAAPSGSTAPQHFTPTSQPGPTASQDSMPVVQPAPGQFNPIASHSSMPAAPSGSATPQHFTAPPQPGPMASYSSMPTDPSGSAEARASMPTYQNSAPGQSNPMASHSSLPAAPSGSPAPQSFVPPYQPGPTASQNSLPYVQSGQSHPMASHSSSPSPSSTSGSPAQQTFMPPEPAPTASHNSIPAVQSNSAGPAISPVPLDTPTPAIGRRIPVPEAFLNRTIALGSPQALQAVSGPPLVDVPDPNAFEQPDIMQQQGSAPLNNPSAKPGNSLSNLIAIPPYNQRSSRTNIPAQPSTASADFPGLFQPTNPDDIPALEKLVGAPANASEARSGAATEGPLWKAPASSTVVPTTPLGSGPPAPWGQAGGPGNNGPNWGPPGLAQQAATPTPQTAPPPPWGTPTPSPPDDAASTGASWADASIPPESAIQALTAPIASGVPAVAPLPARPDNMSSSKSGITATRPFLQDNTGKQINELTEVTSDFGDGSDHTVQVSKRKSKSLDWNAVPPAAPAPTSQELPQYQDMRETVAVPPPVDKKTPTGHEPFDVAALNAIPTPSVKAPKPIMEEPSSTPVKTPPIAPPPPSRPRYSDDTDGGVRSGGASALRFNNSRGGAESKKRILITASCLAICIFIAISVFILIGVKPKTSSTDSTPAVTTQTAPPTAPVPTSAIPTSTIPAPPPKPSPTPGSTTTSSTPPVVPLPADRKKSPSTPTAVPELKKKKAVIAKAAKKFKRSKAAKPADSTAEVVPTGPKRRRAYSTVDSYMQGGN